MSNPDLCVAQCKSGVVGSFPALSKRPGDALDKWITDVKNRLDENDAPFAVNQIVHRSNARLMKDMEVIVKHGTHRDHGSGARPEINEAALLRRSVFHDVINNKFAKKAVEKGADGLVLGLGRGGTRGRCRPFRSLVKCGSGGTAPSRCRAPSAAATGRRPVAGARACDIGGSFIATHEANASGPTRTL